MTVCIGVLCAGGAAAIGASDQMISTADNQTKRLKIHHLTDSVVVMISGDVAIHAELMIELRAVIDANSDRPEILTVKNMADSYATAFASAKRRRAERQVLAPLGLDARALTSGQVDEKMAEKLAKEMLYFAMPECSAIFMGADSSAGYMSAHLYKVENEQIQCCDGSGYACIGVGWYQAASSLMFSGYKLDAALDQALYLTFAAKKRAEVAPGVGPETDMVYVANDQSKYIMFNDKVLGSLECIYARAEKAHSKTNQAAERRFHEFLDTLRRTPVEQRPAQKLELSGTPVAEGAKEDMPSAGAGEPATASRVQQADGQKSSDHEVEPAGTANDREHP
jgi:hypothetical protein